MTSTLNIEPSAVAAGTLDLDGEELALRSIDIDGVTLSEGSDYALTEDGISLLKLPLSKFALTTTVAIKPQDNTQLSGNYARAQTTCTPSLLLAVAAPCAAPCRRCSLLSLPTIPLFEPPPVLSGLYKSSGMYVTQCEAEGFRRITYFQDRPDVMAKYLEVRLEADKAKYPLLLSNGNEVNKVMLHVCSLAQPQLPNDFASWTAALPSLPSGRARQRPPLGKLHGPVPQAVVPLLLRGGGPWRDRVDVHHIIGARRALGRLVGVR